MEGFVLVPRRRGNLQRREKGPVLWGLRPHAPLRANGLSSWGLRPHAPHRANGLSSWGLRPRALLLSLLFFALPAAAGQPPGVGTGAEGPQLSLGLGYPQTVTLGLGYRLGLGPAAVSAAIEYQPPLDQTFLDTSLDLAVRGYFAPVDATSLFKANGQFFVGFAAGRYEFSQTQTAGASKDADAGTYTRKTRVTGGFLAPTVGFQLYDGKGHQLETDLGWFKPLGHATSIDQSCQGAQALCDQAAPGLPDAPIPAYLRTSGWHVTLIRYVWTI